jgi:hypothetical protein
MEVRIIRLVVALFLGTFVLATSAIGQVTNLTGNINTYLDVSFVNAVANSVTVPSTAGLSIGDTVFLIQMQGATMNTADAATFGDISSLNSAGKFEFNIICDFAGNDVILERMMQTTYDAASGLQLIPVRVYANVAVTGTVSAPAWDGNLGGVVVIAAPSGWVRLNANIDVNGRGFRGGTRQDMVSGCTCANGATQYTSYFYGTANWRGAHKGEGIAVINAGMEAGKGKQTNGGGGGNDHNSGGAGGANYGIGGAGGNASASSCFFGAYCRGLNPGIGGIGLGGYYSNAEGRLFLGGGGGAGHYGNASIGGGSPGGDGERGGGIVVIWADSINGNGFSINANGNNVAPISAADGGGGGGAGGVVVLDARAFSAAALNVNARGGDGADHSWGAGATNCKGTGGGGGGGTVWFRSIANPPTVITNVTGGIAGIQGGASCAALGNNGSTNGGNGAVLNSFARVFASAGFPACILPIELAYFNAEKAGSSAVALNWRTNMEVGNFQFAIERSVDALHYETIGRVASLAGNGTGTSYNWTDHFPVNGNNWYRLRQIDRDGRSTLSESVLVQFQGREVVAVRALYPNPVSVPHEVILELSSPAPCNAVVSVNDIVGKMVYQVTLPLEEGVNSFRLPTQSMTAGIYFLKVNAGMYGEFVHKLKVN